MVKVLVLYITSDGCRKSSILWTDSLDPDTIVLRHACFPKCLVENELNAIS